MKIGIVVYSQTGHILSIAESLKELLNHKGHEAVIDRIEIAPPFDEERAVLANATLSHIPNTDDYEGIIFASPVQGFSLARIMPPYFSHVGSLNDKRIAHFIAHHLPPFFGGNKGSKHLSRLIRNKEGESLGNFKVKWSDENKDETISIGIVKLSKLFD